jgi:rfaE bifunctional protein nucleotidyltransferase chain/domain
MRKFSTIKTDLKSSKLFEFSEACARRERLRHGGKVVALTNGCFDLLHAGHIFSLEAAKSLCDSLWVALNSDGSVRSLKSNQRSVALGGIERPFFGEAVRAYMLSALEFVDGIFIFEGTRLDGEITAFRPDVYVKSGDYTFEKLDITEIEALKSVGASIEIVPFLEGFSTTSIVGKIAADSQFVS